MTISRRVLNMKITFRRVLNIVFTLRTLLNMVSARRRSPQGLLKRPTTVSARDAHPQSFPCSAGSVAAGKQTVSGKKWLWRCGDHGHDSGDDGDGGDGGNGNDGVAVKKKKKKKKKKMMMLVMMTVMVMMAMVMTSTMVGLWRW